MESKKSFLKDFIFTIKPKKYIELMNRKFLRAFMHITVVALILGLIQGCISIGLFTSVEKIFTEGLKSEELNFELKDGILNFKNSPYKEEEGQLLLLIDTDKNVNEIDSLKNIIVHKEIASVFLKDGVVIRNGTEEVSVKYSELGLSKEYLNNEIVLGTMEKLKVVKYLLIPIAIVMQFILLIICGLLVSLIGLLSNSLYKTKVEYREIFKLSLYSITFPSLLSLFIPSIGIVVMAGGFILSFAISGISMSRDMK